MLGLVAIVMYRKGCGGEMGEAIERTNNRAVWVAAFWYDDPRLPSGRGFQIRWVGCNRQDISDWCEQNPGFFLMSGSTANILLEQTHRPTFVRAVNLDSSHN
jgi:hypothetical protein